ncbi:MAG: multidrug effflux MFS transporter [Pseudomonadales bacterium]|nr:multidrug effflux MFS transporter [Pseudomonadales bacterium]
MKPSDMDPSLVNVSSKQDSEKNTEFIVLMALLMSLVALTVDAMLPAMDLIGMDLAVQDPNQVQWIISAVFVGMALGLMVYGPVSDSFGRKRAIYIGIWIFLIGSVIALVSDSFYMMIAGRLIQGFGAASCRIVTMAMIRDRFSGNEMARIMSLLLLFFILVPALAPAIGQFVLWVAHWRGIFLVILLLGVIGLLWFTFRQPETLVKEKRLSFSFSVIVAGMAETIKHPVARSYMLAAGLVFGALVGYLTSAQQIYQGQYQVGDLFAFYFGILALAVGLSSYLNSKLVMRVTMAKLCISALVVLSLSSIGFFVHVWSLPAQPPLFDLMLYLSVGFFCLGIPFGNFNAMAVQPLGHIAGVASSVIGCFQTIISVGVGSIIGQLYDGTVIPLLAGFTLCSLGALVIVLWIERTRGSD